MLKWITLPIRYFVNLLGYEIVKTKYYPAKKNVHDWLRALEIDEIIDIGANEGQAALQLSKILPGRKIYAIEPIKHCFDRLLKNTRHLNIVPFHCALGAEDEISQINVSKNLVSSSILPMEKLHEEHFTESVYVRSEEIQIRRLDSLLKDKIDFNKRILVKVDVQGYEEKVLKGGVVTFSNATCVIIEISFGKLYKDQWLFKEVNEFFVAQGFTFLGMYDQILSKTGIPMYGDAIFVKNHLVDKLYQ